MSRRTIPIAPAADPQLAACSGAEAFALVVLGDSMAPEFVEGDVIVVEPEGLAGHGSFVLARVDGEWIFRQLLSHGGGWQLAALDGHSPRIELADLAPVRGVVIQRNRGGRRALTRRYASDGTVHYPKGVSRSHRSD